jgi:hypothetical protein
MTRRIHALMEDPGDTDSLFTNLVQHKMVFNPVATAARKQFIALLAQAGVVLQGLQAVLQARRIRIHLRCSPRLQGVLQDIVEIFPGKRRKLDDGLTA